MQASKKLPPLTAIYLGIGIVIPCVFIILLAFVFDYIFAVYLFLPLMLIYVGISFIFGNASSVAMQTTEDKSTASAMMNFINMGIATLSVLLLGFTHTTSTIVLPLFFCALIIIGLCAACRLKQHVRINA